MQNSQKNVHTIIILLFCYYVAIIEIIVELLQKLFMCKKTLKFIEQH